MYFFYRQWYDAYNRGILEVDVVLKTRALSVFLSKTR